MPALVVDVAFGEPAAVWLTACVVMISEVLLEGFWFYVGCFVVVLQWFYCCKWKSVSHFKAGTSGDFPSMRTGI